MLSCSLIILFIVCLVYIDVALLQISPDCIFGFQAAESAPK